MSKQDEAKPGTDRREFLRAVAGGALGVAAVGGMTLLEGCGIGSGKTSVAATATGSMPVSVQVNSSEVGGARLSVTSAFRPDALDIPPSLPASPPALPNPPPSGPAQTQANTLPVSTDAVQLLYCKDENGAVRCLCLSNPSDHQGRRTRAEPPFIRFDAESTAVSLVFITPGIMSSDPTEGQQLTDQIKSLGSFAPLKDYLGSNLAATPLAALRTTDALDALVQACIDDWQNTYASKSVSVRHAAGPGGKSRSSAQDKAGRFRAETDDNAPRDNKKVYLTNSAWRVVHVDRQILDYAGNQLDVKDGLFRTMGGAEPASWGGLLTGVVGRGSQLTDYIDLTPFTGAYSIVYWVRGPGNKFARGDVYVPTSDLPSSIHSSATDAWGVTLLHYAVFPLMDLALGSKAILKKVFGGDGKGALLGQAVWDHVKDKIDPTSWIMADETSFNTKEIKKQLIDLMIALLGLAATVIGVLEIGGAIAVGIAYAAEIIAEASIALGIANVGKFVSNTLFVGELARYELPAFNMLIA